MMNRADRGFLTRLFLDLVFLDLVLLLPLAIQPACAVQLGYAARRQVEAARFVQRLMNHAEGGGAMARTVGYYVGLLYLGSGIAFLLKPRLGFGLWESKLRSCFPSSIGEVVTEYSHLSDTSLRYLCLSYMLDGTIMLWLATTSGRRPT